MRITTVASYDYSENLYAMSFTTVVNYNHSKM